MAKLLTPTSAMDVDPAADASTELAVATSPQPLSRVEERRRWYAAQDRSAATRRAYEGQWARFDAWATGHGVRALAADAKLVAQYLVGLADEGLGMSSVGQAFAAIGYRLQRAGAYWNPKDPELAPVIEAIRRKLKARPNKKAPITEALLPKMLGAVSESSSKHWWMDRTILLVGWFAALRRSEIVALRWGDVRFAAEGLVIDLPQSKTDQHGEGEVIGVHFQPNEQVCAVRYLHGWKQMKQKASSKPLDGSTLIFPRGADYVGRLIKRVCRQLGLDAESFSSHSLRRGLITSLGQRKVPLYQIMQQSRHVSDRVARGYIDDTLVFENNVTKELFKAE